MRWWRARVAPEGFGWLGSSEPTKDDACASSTARLARPDSLPLKRTRPAQPAPDPHKPEESPKISSEGASLAGAQCTPPWMIVSRHAHGRRGSAAMTVYLHPCDDCPTCLTVNRLRARMWGAGVVGLGVMRRHRRRKERRAAR
jgi:hypothetical protein